MNVNDEDKIIEEKKKNRIRIEPSITLIYNIFVDLAFEKKVKIFKLANKKMIGMCLSMDNTTVSTEK